MKNKLVIALFVGMILVSGIASAQVATTTTTSTTASTVATTTPACPTFVAVDVVALRARCSAEGGVVYQPEATSGCLPPPICQKTDKFICPMISMPNIEQFASACTAQGGRVVARTNKNGCQIAPVCEKQLVRKAELTINPQGQFIARGMVVKSVASTTFVGEVWGTTWTIDFSSVKNIILKSGSEQKVDTVATQVLVGQEVGVQGRLSNGVVVAQIVRNYNQTEVVVPMPGTPMWERQSEDKKNQLEKQNELNKKQLENRNEADKKTIEMLERLQELQNKLKSMNNR